ncbi:telomere length regulation protein-domain-containing protein [Leucosporidium creatinivorum]|uniref:Telomere length regulation protein-domain-containing protein n=1 Tax=Leucosporidium creatinivorum TaxID=106004 RepID=A0A1Y2FHN6_9BASI|nr:telomere length regulation protein-domain-containing protein [Leucosporidium creatinivorum]
MATVSPPLSTLLAEPLTSTNQLLSLIAPPLARLDLLQDQPELLERFPGPAAEGSDDASKFLKRQLGLVQKALVERVWPDWEAAVAAEEGDEVAKVVFERWFMPASFEDPKHAEVALSAYAVLSSLLSSRATPPLQRRSLELAFALLARLASAFSLKEAYVAILGQSKEKNGRSNDSQAAERWERVVKDLLSLPTKVANAWGALADRAGVPMDRPSEGIPEELDWSAYESGLSRSFADLLWSNTPFPLSETSTTALSTPLSALASSPSFLPTLLPILTPRLLPSTSFPTPTEELLHRRAHAEAWRELISELSERNLTRLLRKVLATVDQDLLRQRGDGTASLSQRIRGASFLLSELFGPLSPKEELWKVVLPIVLEEGEAWDAEQGGMARVLLSWVGADVEARVALMEAVMGVWGRADGIKGAGAGSRAFLTTTLLLAVYSLPPLHPSAVALSRSPAFLGAISAHLSLIQPTTRLLGMLVAELVSAATISPGGELTPLSFGDDMWEGSEEGKEVARRIRAVVQEKEEPVVEGWQQALRSRWEPMMKVEQTIFTPLPRSTIPTPIPVVSQPPTSRPLISVISDPDDLQPYPLPAPPSASVLSALASDDASLYSTALPSTSASTTRKRGKLRAPVYVPELVAYLKGTDPEGKKEEADGEAERVEVGLNEGESLVRRKAGWGGELAENAVDLAFALMTLQDTYDVDNFEQLKLNIMTALVAAVPTKVAPTLIEQYFFNNYSVAQRHTILTAIALGARELSGLPLPPQLAVKSAATSKVGLFPSKRLPPTLHHRFAEAETAPALPAREPDALDSLAAQLTATALSSAKEGAETTMPEASREKLLTVRRFASAKSTTAASSTSNSQPSFPTLAAEFFILPLINRFWLYLRDTAATPSRGPYSSVGGGSNAGGSASLLSPLVLSKYLSTLSLLIHAARHSHHFLLSIVPSALQLVLALRSTVLEETDSKVLETEMELLLVVFDAVVAFDGGESLMGRSVEGGNELVGLVKEWAEETFELEEARSKGGAGMGRAGRASAGVLLRIEEVLGRYRGKLGW